MTLIGAVIGTGGIASLLSAILTIRWTRHSAKFNGMKVEQDTYQELISDLKTAWKEQKDYIGELHDDRRHLREERDDMKKQIDVLKKKVNEQQGEIDDLKRIVRSLKPLLCSQVGCKSRQSDIIGLISDDSFD